MNDATLFEFASHTDLLRAVDALNESGHTPFDAFTPYAIPELEAKLGIRRSRIPRVVFLAAAIGCATAYAIIWFTNAHSWPLNVGGRPLNSIPSDIPIMFETTVLFGSITAFALALLRSKMPRLYDPVFEVEGIESVSIDHFWVAVRGNVDDETCAKMNTLGAQSIKHAELPS
jgi:hypothetical protein